MLSLHGVNCQKLFTGTALSLNFNTFPFVDSTGRHTVSGGVQSGSSALFTVSPSAGAITISRTNKDFLLVGDFGITCTINMPVLGSNQTIWILGTYSTTDYVTAYVTGTGSITVYLPAFGVATAMSSNQTGYTIPLSTPVVVKVAKIGTKAYLYCDGVIRASVNLGALVKKHRDLYLGDTQGVNAHFVGTIDDCTWVNYGKTLFNAQFATDSRDATGRYTTTNVGGVTFSGGRAVWSTESPPRYLVTNEDVDWDHSKTLVVSARINSTTGTGVGKALWTISNAAANSYIRAIQFAVTGAAIAIQVNGTTILSTSPAPEGTDYDLVVKYYSNGFTEIYIDGLLSGTGTLPTLAAASRKLYIGYSPTFVTYSHNGTIDYLTVEEV